MALKNLYVITILPSLTRNLEALTQIRFNWRLLYCRHECEITCMRSSSISLDRYGSKIRKVSRCRPAASNKTILATRQEFILTKVVPVQSITDIVLLLD